MDAARRFTVAAPLAIAPACCCAVFVCALDWPLFACCWIMDGMDRMDGSEGLRERASCTTAT